MKIYKLLTILFSGLLLTLSERSAAQITISTYDMPMASNIIYTVYDTVTSSLSRLGHPAGGANVAWDYSFLPATFTDTDALVIPPITPYAHYFLSASMADSTYGTPGYTYFSNTDSAYSCPGTVQQALGINVAMQFTPSWLQIKLPAHYGDVDSGTVNGKTPAFAVTGVTGVDSGKGTLTVTYRDTINGYGEITTPLSGGTTYAVLCQKKYAKEVLNEYAHEGAPFNQWVSYGSYEQKGYTYTWYANGVGYPVVTMQVDYTNTQVTSVQWYKGYITGINELSHHQSMSVYPNPCNGQFTIKLSVVSGQLPMVEVYNVLGEQVLTETLQPQTSKGALNEINLSSQPDGVYLYRVITQEGSLVGEGKLIIQK